MCRKALSLPQCTVDVKKVTFTMVSNKITYIGDKRFSYLLVPELHLLVCWIPYERHAERWPNACHNLMLMGLNQLIDSMLRVKSNRGNYVYTLHYGRTKTVQVARVLINPPCDSPSLVLQIQTNDTGDALVLCGSWLVIPLWASGWGDNTDPISA